MTRYRRSGLLRELQVTRGALLLAAGLSAEERELALTAADAIADLHDALVRRQQDRDHRAGRPVRAEGSAT